MDIILYLLTTIQDLYRQNCWLITFICRYIPLKQWAFDDSYSPEYQKFKTDELPKIEFHNHEWDWRLLIPYFEHRYNIKIKPIARRKECNIPDDCTCPFCNAPKPYLYSNNGDKGQILCKVCETTFSPQENRFSKMTILRCPHCTALWVAYYNFLRPHKHAGNKVLNEVDLLKGADNMPGKWQLLIFLGQQTILNLQNQTTTA